MALQLIQDFGRFVTPACRVIVSREQRLEIVTAGIVRDRHLQRGFSVRIFVLHYIEPIQFRVRGCVGLVLRYHGMVLLLRLWKVTPKCQCARERQLDAGFLGPLGECQAILTDSRFDGLPGCVFVTHAGCISGLQLSNVTLKFVALVRVLIAAQEFF